MSEIEKSEFLSSVSHEIRTHLNTIVGLSEDIGEYEDIPEEIREDAEDLVTSSKTLFEFIENILDYIAIEKNEVKIVNNPYNPKDLFERIAKTDEEFIGDNPVYLHTNIDEHIPYELIGDKKHIEKIVNNLLLNSIKYTEGGDIWFDVSSINNNDESTLVINIKDTGRGMTEEEMSRLFKKIVKLDARTDSRSNGTEVGLTVTKSLVDMMGGTIKAESTFGEGTTFEVTIPQKISQIEESELSRTQRLRLQQINYEEEGYGYKKVLVVDDNILNIKVVRRILEQFDLVLDECYNGAECINMVSENNDYDLILMDIMMPGMNGVETLRKLKELDGFDTPVIALTAEAESGSQEKYINEGFADYIAKPFSKAQIEEKMDKVFKEKDLENEEQEW